MLFGGLIFIGGCAEKPLEPIVEKEVSFYDLNENPRELSAANMNAGLSVVLINYCWNEDDSICNLDIINTAKALEGIKTQVLEKGETVTLRFDVNPSSKAPLPSNTRLYQFKDDIVTEVNVTPNGAFTIPNEKGRYNYGYLSLFEDDIKGQAYYGFSVIVK